MQLAEAQRQAEESHDKYLRLAAEMENTRKRIERNVEARALREKRDLLARLLEITDDLERAAGVFKRELENFPGSYTGHFYLGRISEHTKRDIALFAGRQRGYGQ